MSETKHTPGPWRTATGFVRAKTGVICQLSHPHSLLRFVSYDEEIANARLIAAAPDLLAACKMAKEYLVPDLIEPGRTVFWALVAAIDQAEKE